MADELNFDDDDFGLDAELSSNNNEDGTLAEGPDGSRNPVTKSLKDVSVGFRDELTDNKLETLGKIAKGVIPTSLSKETRMVTDIKSKLDDEYKEAIKQVRPVARNALNNIERVLPKDGLAANLLNKIKDKLGTDETNSGPTREQIQEESIRGYLNDIMGEKTDKEKYENLIEQQVQANRHKSDIELQSNIAANTERMRKFQFEITNSYYRKSLELQYKSLFIAKDQKDILRDGFNTFKNQFENIIKNTGLPDILKMRNIENMERILKEKTFSKITDRMFNNNDKIAKIKDNISIMGDNLRNKVVDIVSTTGDIAGQAADGAEMANMGGGAGGIFGSILSDFATSSLGKKLYKYVEKNDKIKKGIFEAKNMAYDPNEHLKSIRDKYSSKDGMINNAVSGVYGFAADVTNTNNNISNTRVDRSNMDEAAMFDNRAYDSLVKVIPRLLSKINAELIHIRKGDKSDTANSELRYSYESGKFETTKQMKSGLTRMFSKDINKNTSIYIHEFVDLLIKYGGLKSTDQKTLDNISKGLVKYIMSGNSLMPSRLLINKFHTYFSGNLKNKMKGYISNLINASIEDPLVMDRLTTTLDNIKSNLPGVDNLIKNSFANGNIDVLNKLGLVKKTNSGYEVNKDNVVNQVTRATKYSEKFDKPEDTTKPKDVRKNMFDKAGSEFDKIKDKTLKKTINIKSDLFKKADDLENAVLDSRYGDRYIDTREKLENAKITIEKNMDIILTEKRKKKINIAGKKKIKEAEEKIQNAIKIVKENSNEDGVKKAATKIGTKVADITDTVIEKSKKELKPDNIKKDINKIKKSVKEHDFGKDYDTIKNSNVKDVLNKVDKKLDKFDNYKKVKNGISELNKEKERLIILNKISKEYGLDYADLYKDSAYEELKDIEKGLDLKPENINVDTIDKTDFKYIKPDQYINTDTKISDKSVFGKTVENSITNNKNRTFTGRAKTRFENIQNKMNKKMETLDNQKHRLLVLGKISALYGPEYADLYFDVSDEELYAMEDTLNEELDKHKDITKDTIKSAGKKINDTINRKYDEFIGDKEKLEEEDLVEINEQQTDDLKNEFYSSREYKLGLVTNFQTWLRTMGYKPKKSMLARLNDIFKKTRALDRKIMKGGLKLLAKSPLYAAKLLGMGGKLGIAGGKAAGGIAGVGMLSVLKQLTGYDIISNKFGKKKEEEFNKFDKDKSGNRDGSWKDRLNVFKNKNKKDSVKKETNNKNDKKDSGIGMGTIITLVTGAVGLLGKAVNGIFNIPKFLLSIKDSVLGLGSGLIKAISKVFSMGKNIVSGGAGLIGKAGAGIASMLGFGKKVEKVVPTKANKNISESILKKVGKKLMTKAGLKVGGKMLAKVAARSIPFLGWGLAAWDAGKIGYDMVKNGTSFKSAVSKQLLGYDPDDEKDIDDKIDKDLKNDKPETLNDKLKQESAKKIDNSIVKNNIKPVNNTNYKTINTVNDTKETKQDIIDTVISSKLDKHSKILSSGIEIAKDSNDKLGVISDTLKMSLDVQIKTLQAIEGLGVLDNKLKLPNEQQPVNEELPRPAISLKRKNYI